jgi:HEAT repeat protein
MQWLAEAEREQSASVGIASLQDYLALERDRHQFDQVAEVWVESMREALRDRADRRVRELLTAVEGIKVPGDDRAFSAVFVPATLRADVIVSLMTDPEKEGRASAVQMLEPFGEWGIEALFDQLAEENDRGRRAALLGVIRSLVPGRIGAVAARLGDHRWYVVRNAVNVLRHTGDPQVLDLLAGAAQHESDPVRREAVWGLVSGGPAALPHLVAAASSSDGSVRRMTVEALGTMPVAEAADALAGIVVSGRDLGTRRLALERLATNRAPESADQLQALVAKRRPKLPRSLRRRARVLAKEGSS